MANTNNRHKPIMGGPGMRGTGEKPKNFKKSVIRLIKELKSFRVLIILSLILAMASSVLSIFAPNKLSDLTDQISEGLVVNIDNLKEITTNVTTNLDEEKISETIPQILNIKLDEDTISNIMISKDISENDKIAFQKFITSNLGQDNMLIEITKLPESILEIILADSIYDDVAVSTEDKLALINVSKELEDSKNISDINIPSSIEQILFKSFTIDNITITSNDQLKFLKVFSTIDSDNIEAEELYKKIDEMPKNIQKAVEPNMNMEKIKSITIFLVIIYVCSALFMYIQSLSMTDVANKFAKKLRSRISVKINKLPLKYFDRNSTGDVLSRVTNDIDIIAQTMNQSLASLVSATTLFIGTIVMMFITNYIMAITAILSSLIGFIFMFMVLNKSQKYFVSRQVELGNLNGHIEEVYSGLNVVKTYNGKNQSNQKFDLYNKKVYEADRKSQFLSGLMQPLMIFIGNFGYVAVCIVGALLVMNDIISFGVIVAFISYVRLFTSPLSQIAQSMTSLQSTAAAGERVFEFVDEKEMVDESSFTHKLDLEQAKGKIEFKNVVFKYDGNDKPTINDFSAIAKPGQKIAIVGPTGAGKTTIVNLLMKFYEINSGDIVIDGVSINDLTRENIHDLFTMVLQDTWLFNGTVKENIIYNREDISDEKVKEVCRIVGLDHFIKTLPHGYDSMIGDNDSVSAGQRQLLTIARGMIKNSPYLILDEATSNVDTRTEELVQKAMDKLTEGRTSFIIAHRLSTIKNADLILVIKNGNIIEQGNHNALMKKNGFYADLYNSQFEL